MTLKQQLTEDMKTAMKARDSVRLGVIRFLLSEIRNFEIDNGEQDDAGVLKIIAKEVKQMSDVMVEFGQAGRTDLVDAEKEKVAVLKAYLPQQLSDEELEAIVIKVVAASDEKQMGKVISAAMAEVAGRADGGRVAALVKKALQ